MKLDADQENALAEAYDVSTDLQKRLRQGRPASLVPEWDSTVAAEVFSWLGCMTPGAWDKLRGMSADTRASLEATAPKPEVSP